MNAKPNNSILKSISCGKDRELLAPPVFESFCPSFLACRILHLQLLKVPLNLKVQNCPNYEAHTDAVSCVWLCGEKGLTLSLLLPDLPVPNQLEPRNDWNYASNCGFPLWSLMLIIYFLYITKRVFNIYNPVPSEAMTTVCNICDCSIECSISRWTLRLV